MQADLKTITALGGYGLTALTSVVSETPLIVSKVQLLDAAMVQDQIQVLVEAFPIKAAKTGMLGAAPQIEAVVTAWKPMAESGVPLVVDPVMVATSGGRLLDEAAVSVMTGALFPLARIITPNMDEAAVLLGDKITTRQQMEEGARALAGQYGCAVLLKGGHLESNDAPDVLVDGAQTHWLENRRVHGVHTHGTGCTLSAAIAAGLAHGLELTEAVMQAKTYVAKTITQHLRWGGIDALNHQHASWSLASAADTL